MESASETRKRASRMLVTLVNEHGNMTLQLAIELARMLCHIAGGDGRGTYEVVHTR